MMTQQEQRQQAAVQEMLNVLDGILCNDLGPHLTCTEANVFAEFLRAFDSPGAADALIEGHCLGDEDGDDEDHLRLQKQLEGEEVTHA